MFVNKDRFPLRFQILALGLAGMFPALMAGTAGAQGITPTAASVTEGDAAPVDAAFRYSFPVGLAGSFEFAVIPINMQPGTDFVPYRQTWAAAAGTVLEGTAPVPVLPDWTEEENGSLSLVVRGPGSADWAASLGAPVTVDQFNAANGGGEVLYWGDDKVVGARMRPDGAGSEVVTWERTATGGLVPRSGIPFEEARAFDAQVNASAVVLPMGSTLKTWLQAADNPFAWQPVAMDLAEVQGTPRLFEDRLAVISRNGVNGVYRRDPSAATGWRRTGEMGRGAVTVTAKDFAATHQNSMITVWEREAGSEDQWGMMYEIRTDFTADVMAAAPGMLVVSRPAGLEIYERTAGVWGKTATLPVTPPSSSDKRMSVVAAGDWIAVGVGSSLSSGEAGSVRLFLRSATDRTVWNPAGTLTGPGDGYGRNLIWNGLELVSSGVISGRDNGVVVRKFQGAATVVVDDDRSKLSLTAFTLREPISGPGVREVLAELPLPAVSPVTVDYEILPGTAMAGVNFVAATGQVTIPAGAARAPVPITLLAQRELEPAKTLTVRISAEGQAPVAGEVKILESGPPAVVTSSGPQLIEGRGASTVTVRQAPAAGGLPPASPAGIRIFTGGFDETVYQRWFLATRDKDLPSGQETHLLDSASPEASFTLTATDDPVEDFPEAQLSWPLTLPGTDEHVKAVYDGLGTERNAGSFGVAYDGEVPKLPVGIRDNFAFTNFAVDRKWFFANWQNSTSGVRNVLAFHRWDRENGIQPDAVQTVEWAPVRNVQTLSQQVQALSATGETLLGTFRSTHIGQNRSFLHIYEPVGSAEAPWRKMAEWSAAPTKYPTDGPDVEFIDSDQFLWGDTLFQKTTGKWKWRAAASGVQGSQMADHDRLVLPDPLVSGSFTLYHRSGAAQPDWTHVRVFEGFTAARIKGRTLVLGKSGGALDIWREHDERDWRHEQVLEAASPLVRIEESTIITQERIHCRTGSPSAPWTEGGEMPRALEGIVHAGQGTEILASSAGDVDSMSNWYHRLRILWPGAPLSIYDDESLKFGISQPFDMNESWFGESIVEIPLRISRQPPFPVEVHLRSRDNGGAAAGEDYTPFDYTLTILSWPDQRLLLRIMGDRLAEDYESLEVVMDPPSFGYGAGVTKLWIGDSSAWQKPMTAGSAAMLEPASGTLIQAVEFVLPAAMNEDMEFLARVEGAGTAVQGTDFTLPSGPVVLKAGSTRLQVPVTACSDRNVVRK
ncbi:MAG: hypothetical protein EOP86_03560 [Verrucomicrobiaceae bacterium]|nr:MAG: hypothetical protein EOP86_03560 [Verrucomicrobiaceae bacterium]